MTFEEYHAPENKWRRDALNLLEASKPHLMTVTREMFARELVVQGLDLVSPAERADVVAHALEELNQ